MLTANILFCIFISFCFIQVYAQENSTRVYIEKYKAEPTYSLCYEPRSFHVHSCKPTTDIAFPTSLATCKCSVNNQRTVKLSCHTDHLGKAEWLITTSKFPCIGSDDETMQYYVDDLPFCLGKYPSTRIKLNLYWLQAITKEGMCYIPKEYLNYFNSCEEKQYPVNETTCNCTFNSDRQVHLVCDIRLGAKWRIYDQEHPCKYNLMPNIVYCYQDQNAIICNCKSNCFTLDVTTKPTYDEIYGVCDAKNYRRYLKEQHLKLYFNHSQSVNKILYSCETGYELIGPGFLHCQQGKLNGSMPQCVSKTGMKKNIVKVYNKKNETNNESLLQLYQISTFTLLSVLLLTFTILAIYITCKKCKRNYQSSKNLSVEYDDVFTEREDNTKRPHSEHVYDYIELQPRN